MGGTRTGLAKNCYDGINFQHEMLLEVIGIDLVEWKMVHISDGVYLGRSNGLVEGKSTRWQRCSEKVL